MQHRRMFVKQSVLQSALAQLGTLLVADRVSMIWTLNGPLVAEYLSSVMAKSTLGPKVDSV
jgi:hypothetical protein